MYRATVGRRDPAWVHYAPRAEGGSKVPAKRFRGDGSRNRIHATDRFPGSLAINHQSISNVSRFTLPPESRPLRAGEGFATKSSPAARASDLPAGGRVNFALVIGSLLRLPPQLRFPPDHAPSVYTLCEDAFFASPV